MVAKKPFAEGQASALRPHGQRDICIGHPLLDLLETNAELVRHAAGILHSLGAEIASPAETRAARSASPSMIRKILTASRCLVGTRPDREDGAVDGRVVDCPAGLAY
jgi:hypothetical protein